MKHAKHTKAAPGRSRKSIVLAVSVILMLALVVGGTIAYLQDKTDPLPNIFTPSEVTCYVDEQFDGADKTNVKIQNTGNIDAYIRVSIAANNVGTDGKICAIHPANPTFTLGANWVKYGNYYYYTLPVAKNGGYTGIFAEKIELSENADCCKMRVEIIASAVQSTPVDAVVAAWGVDPSALG